MLSTVLLYSGGLDSTILLYDLIKNGCSIQAITFDYGKEDRTQIKRAEEICSENGIGWELIDVKSVYTAIKRRFGDTPEPGFPYRNLIFLSIAGARAYSIGFDNISLGVHGEEKEEDAGSSPSFIRSFRRTLGLGEWDSLDLFIPYWNHSKEKLLRRGKELKVPFEKFKGVTDGT